MSFRNKRQQVCKTLINKVNQVLNLLRNKDIKVKVLK